MVANRTGGRQAVIRGIILLLQMTGVPRLIFRLMLDRRGPARLKLILPTALVYLLSPIDVVPDILPVLGRLDDVLVLLISLVAFLGMAPRDVVASHLGSVKAQERDSRPNKNVIEGKYHFVDDEEFHPQSPK